MTEQEFTTKEFCQERSGHISESVDKLGKQLDKHCGHIDITFAEIFRLLKEQNSKSAYNQGVADTLKKNLNKGLTKKTLVAIIAGINAGLLTIVEIIKAIIR